MSDSIQAQFTLTYFDSPKAGRLAIMTMDNGHDHTKPTVFGEPALNSLNAALDELAKQTDVKGMLLTGKPFIFAVGADTDAFIGADEAMGRTGGEEGHKAFGRIQALPFPTLAAINGACMGGGLEIALHCDYRTLSSTAAAVAFPEVFLNIFPAWNGTQLATKLVGAENALQAIVHDALNNNTIMRPKKAFERGFADRLIHPAGFLDDSIALLADLVSGDEVIERAPVDHGNLDELLANARAFADAKTHGATRAPYVAIDLIEFAARGGNAAEGLKLEEDGLAELLPSRQAQASVYAFDLTQRRVKKQPWRPKVKGRPVKQIAVIGSGLMGAQLGSLFLQKYEVPLVMKDIDEGVLVKAKAFIDGDLDKRVQRGRMTEGKATFLKNLVNYTVDYGDVAGSDFVIEAVLERMDLKKMIFADLEKVLDEGAILATNTSSLSITEMASDLKHPERVVGFHFFNPVAVLPLVEVIRAGETSDEAYATAFDVAKKLRKSAVACADAPAFIVNRLLIAFNGAAVQALRHGNTFQEIDTAIKGLGLPMGPFELFGLVGLKVAYHTAETLEGAFPERYAIDDNFRKIGEMDVPGIYDWSNGGAVYPQILEAVEVEAGVEKMTDDQIRQVALDRICDEIVIMLDDNVIADARDVDTCMIFGAGWPFFTGGIAKYLDQVGISQKRHGRDLVGAEDNA